MRNWFLVLVFPLAPGLLFAQADVGTRIVAGPVELNAGRLSGSFQLQSPGTHGSSASPASGGACLIYSERRRGGAVCQRDSDCADDPPFQGGAGYCLHDVESSAGRCWRRPAETPAIPYCRRSHAATLLVGEQFQFPLDAAGHPAPVAQPRPGWWRVHACLNLKPGACAVLDNTDKQTDDGPARQVRGTAASHGETKAPAGDAARLQTVVVTARQREEELQQVPVAVTTLSATELQSRGADDLSALGAAVPNLTIYAARPFNNAVTAYIRGVGQSEPVWGVEPGVGVYIDDVYLARPQAALLDILDVERIEVLRGPQGTLYGRNTIAGAIKYLTRRPDADFSSSVGLTIGSFARRDIKAIANLPISEHLLTRVAVASYDRGGYGSNLLTGKEVSARDAQVARLAAEWSPGNGVDVRLAYDRYRDRSGPRGAKRLTINPNDPARTPPDDGNFDVRSGAPDLDNADAQGWSATVDWDIDGRWRLKSVTARRWSSSLADVDFDSLPLPINDLIRALAEQQTSQEFQLTGHAGALHALAGIYLFDGKAAGRVGNLRAHSYMLSAGNVKTRSAAVYGDLAWDLAERWSLEAGLRYTREVKTGTVLNQGYTDGSFTKPNGVVFANFVDSTTFGSLSPRINLSWRISDHAMAYAQVSRGFKAGGYNIRANTLFVPESGQPFRDENALAREIGAKSDWLDGRLTVNAAIFDTSYRDIQLSVFTSYDSNGDGVRDAFFGDFKNAGAGRIQGAEMELGWRPGETWRWLAHAGYLDTKYDEFISGGVDIAEQQRFTNAPRWSGGMSLAGDFALASGAAISARIDANYQSKVYPTTELSEFIAQGGYALCNASLGWHSPARRWDLMLVGQNLGNRAYRTTGYDIPVLGLRTGFYGPPRTLSLSASYFFR